MTKREKLSKKYNDNLNKIELLKMENIVIYKERCLLSDDKQWYTEETVTVGKGKKKQGILVGKIHWNEAFKDVDNPNEPFWVTRSQTVKKNGEWVSSLIY